MIEKRQVAFAIMVVVPMVSWGGELFEYKRDANIMEDLKGKITASDRLEFLSKDSRVVKLNFDKLLEGEQVVEANLPGSKKAYFKTIEILRDKKSATWKGYVLPTAETFDDYDIPDYQKEMLKSGSFTLLQIYYDGDPPEGGVGRGISNKLHEIEGGGQVGEGEEIGLAGDFEVFSRGDTYRLIPMKGMNGNHLLIELDLERMPAYGDSDEAARQKKQRFEEFLKRKNK
ncbi:hypothetical protein [Microbulbifer sp.]|uniref:hypothetical protein n=1 Tax=Microbulbifer sp. TaxID=1908541 RepID=UPI0025849CCE|nr:hypothetical protein [Microbulbifer sp.]